MEAKKGAQTNVLGGTTKADLAKMTRTKARETKGGATTALSRGTNDTSMIGRGATLIPDRGLETTMRKRPRNSTKTRPRVQMFGIERSTSQQEIEKDAALITVIKVGEVAEDIKEAEEAVATLVAAVEAEEMEEAEATAVAEVIITRRSGIEMEATITIEGTKGAITTTGPGTNEEIKNGTIRIFT